MTIHPSGVHKLANNISRLIRSFKHRRDAGMLAGLDERMLADIGLTRSDLRDAFAEPLWRDPTIVLVDRARDRRRNRVKSKVRGQAAAVVSLPPIAQASSRGSVAV